MNKELSKYGTQEHQVLQNLQLLEVKLRVIQQCPFCAGDITRPVYSGSDVYIECSNSQCGAKGPWTNSVQKAYASWNNRPTLETK